MHLDDTELDVDYYDHFPPDQLRFIKLGPSVRVVVDDQPQTPAAADQATPTPTSLPVENANAAAPTALVKPICRACNINPVVPSMRMCQDCIDGKPPPVPAPTAAPTAAAPHRATAPLAYPAPQDISRKGTTLYASLESARAIFHCVKAAGVLCCSYDEEQQRPQVLLMEESNGNLHPIGGKIEAADHQRPELTAAREFLVCSAFTRVINRIFFRKKLVMRDSIQRYVEPHVHGTS